jgi:hypothetical protein
MTETQHVFCEVGTEILNIIMMNLMPESITLPLTAQ